MELIVSLIELRAGTADDVVSVEDVPCPDNVEPHMLLPFLEARLGPPLEIAWTTTPQDETVDIGWVFAGSGGTEVVATPLMRDDDGETVPLFEWQARHRERFAAVAREWLTA